MRILHLLQWRLSDIEEKLLKIKEQGFDCVQISPLQGTKEENREFWVLYQPINFKIGNSQIGDKSDLVSLCSKANKLGLKVIVDIVFRHTANNNIEELKPSLLNDKEIKPEFFSNAPNIKDHNSRYECINYSHHLPMLDYNNTDLQKLYVKYLNDLSSCGVGGFRIDMAKHFALPEEGSIFYDIFKPFSDKIIIGEAILCDKEVIDAYSKYIYVCTDSFGSNKNKLVVWSESHDEYLTFGITKKLSENHINQHYYNLCRNYPNTLYYARPFSNAWELDIVRLANL